jgi:PPOX class probable F420-dependent enzyme
MGDDEAWQRLAASASASLATLAADGSVDLVPIVFLAADRVLYVAIDDVKPKTTLLLGRLDNIRRDPRVTVLADHYDDDWARLWWVRAKGRATVTGDAERGRALDGLAARYPAYAERRPPGEVIRVEVTHLRGWTAVP